MACSSERESFFNLNSTWYDPAGSWLDTRRTPLLYAYSPGCSRGTDSCRGGHDYRHYGYRCSVCSEPAPCRGSRSSLCAGELVSSCEECGACHSYGNSKTRITKPVATVADSRNYDWKVTCQSQEPPLPPPELMMIVWPEEPPLPPLDPPLQHPEDPPLPPPPMMIFAPEDPPLDPPLQQPDDPPPPPPPIMLFDPEDQPLDPPPMP
ncbi:keratin-associated protein 5-3-like [Grus japonensis]|uniref:Keratin-associated protein 5-3-like n=1 Tax=Grus japonensis TaxID=30415 RepID=A0ABC9XUQ1_GRUJA